MPQAVHRDDSPPLSGPPGSRDGRAALVVAAVVLIVGLAKLAMVVWVPVAFALFALAVLYPLHRWFEAHLPNWLAVVASLLTLLGALALYCAGIWLGVVQVEAYVEDHATEIGDKLKRAQAWLAARGLSLAGSGDTEDRWLQRAEQLVEPTFSFAMGMVLVIALFALGLPHVRTLPQRRPLRASPVDWAAVGHEVGATLRSYFYARTVAGLLTGVGVTVACWAIGVELALVWGLVNFLLNYIPTIGSIVAVFPPALFAWVQFDSATMALLTLALVGGVQLVMGAYVDPILQSHYVDMASFVVLTLVILWGWVWGIPGAFIGVPTTLAGVVISRRFESSRWVSELLSRKVPHPRDDR